MVKCDTMNRILFGRWNDNKVVSFISSLGISGTVTVTRRFGANKIDLSIEEALKRYTNDNFMGGIDNVDKDKKLEEHLQKSYVQEVVPYGCIRCL